MATLQEIQQEELKMLLLLDSICQNHGLRYSMIGGTMLGAVRHQGFIPWDDDVDVYMPINDMLKLENVFSSEEYFLQTPRTDAEMPFVMYKIRKLNSYMPEPGMEKLDIEQGIWMDIFGYTCAGKSRWKRNLQRFMLMILQTYRCKFLNAKSERKRVLHTLMTKLPKKTALAIDRHLIEIICKLGDNISDQYFAMDVGKYMFFEKRFFDHQKKYIFEGALIDGIADADAYLRYVFGADYMTPRKWGHIPDYNDVLIDRKRGI